MMGELVEKVLEMLKKNLAGFVVALFVVEGFQTAVYSLSSRLRGSVVADTWRVGLALTQHHQPSLDLQIQVSNVGVQSLTGTECETGAIKWWEGGGQTYQQL